MSKQDKQEPNNQQSVIEDLAVNQDQAEEVKGGPAGIWGGARSDAYQQTSSRWD
jgi:hypothetical protein